MSAGPVTGNVDVIRELLATRVAVDKLGARKISIEEAQQLIDDRYVILRTPAVAGRTGQGRLAAW